MWSRTREPGAGSLERSTSRPGQASDERLRPQLGLWLVPHACNDSPSTGRGAGDAVRAGRPGAGDLPGPPPFTRQVVDPLQGPAEQWAEELADLALSDGVSAFNLATTTPTTCAAPLPRSPRRSRARGRRTVRRSCRHSRTRIDDDRSSGDGPASHRHGRHPQPVRHHHDAVRQQSAQRRAPVGRVHSPGWSRAGPGPHVHRTRAGQWQTPDRRPRRPAPDSDCRDDARPSSLRGRWTSRNTPRRRSWTWA